MSAIPGKGHDSSTDIEPRDVRAVDDAHDVDATAPHVDAVTVGDADTHDVAPTHAHATLTTTLAPDAVLEGEARVGGGLGGGGSLSCTASSLPKYPPSHSVTHDSTATASQFARRPSKDDVQALEARKVDDRLKRKAVRIVEAAAGAARIDDDGVPVDGTPVDERGVPRGWSAVAYNVAKDARKPLKAQPGYLSMMQRVVDSYKRAEAGHVAAPELAADIRVYLQQNVYNYPTRDVSDSGEK